MAATAASAADVAVANRRAASLFDEVIFALSGSRSLQIVFLGMSFMTMDWNNVWKTNFAGARAGTGVEGVRYGLFNVDRRNWIYRLQPYAQLTYFYLTTSDRMHAHQNHLEKKLSSVFVTSQSPHLLRLAFYPISVISFAVLIVRSFS